MEGTKQSGNDRAAGIRSRGGSSLNAASLLLGLALAGCSSSWGNSGQSVSPPIPARVDSSGPGQVPAPAAMAPPISDGVYPNQSITDLFRDSTSPGSTPVSDGVHPNQSITDLFRDSTSSAPPNVPHPPSSYTPVAQPYSPPGQPVYGGPQNAAVAPAAPAAEPPPPSDGVHPNQSITDLFRQ